MTKYVPPSTNETAFNCPHCGALTTQFWFRLFARQQEGRTPLPLLISPDYEPDRKDFDEEEKFSDFVEKVKKIKTYLPLIEREDTNLYDPPCVYNTHLSRCFNCKDVALWIGSKLIYPQKGEAPSPNPDLPENILADYREASTILDLSPRGAAALVRLCIQKLCKHLGQSGENINADIKALVAAGLDSRIQKALDAVRVIGNNAVHPGSMDLSDDRATAESLFRLLNLIAEKMISEPKHVDEVYALLPPGARAAIEARDKK